MTLFGPDISSYQAGLDLSRLTSASFVIAKASQGTYYTDSCYAGWHAQAGALGLPFVWYHFLTTESAAAQAAHTAACVGDRGLPGMLDVEPTGSSRPGVAEVLAYADAARVAGLRLRLVYLPHWYWQQLGSPDLSPLAAHGLHLVSSGYQGGTGSPAALYPGDGASGWDGYGGMTPALYQYTNQAEDGGHALDYNAFRGTAAQLAALLGGSSPTTAGDGDMTPEEHNDLANVYGGMFFGGASMGTVPPGAPTNSLVHKLDYLIAQAQKAAPAVDVDALAAAIAPKLAAGATADQIAHAVIIHLGAVLTAPAAVPPPSPPTPLS